MRLMIALAILAGCSDEYVKGYEEGCLFGTHYGREHGLQAGAACDDGDTMVSPWPAHLVDDGSFEDGRDDGYTECYWVAFDCAYDEASSTRECATGGDFRSSECEATWPRVDE